MSLGMLENGLVVMLTGMGFVIVFLTIMIGVMFIMSAVVKYLNKIFPETVEEVKTTVKKAATNVDEAIAVALAAIAARKG